MKILIFILCLFVTPALAASICFDSETIRTKFKNDTKWVELTRDQWEFLRGIYAMNPNTPAGLPFGDKAALIQANGDDGGMIVFIDADKICTPMPVPKELIDLIIQVGKDEIAHEGIVE